MNYFNDNSESIGQTPLVKINQIAGDRALVLGKIEGRNPAYSVKCRIGASMVWDAEKKKLLKPGMEIIEPTSGNTGIALSYVGAARGYRVKLTMPETMSVERQKLLKAFGAEVVLTPGEKGMTGAIEQAEELASSEPEKYYMPQQFKNPANPEIHEKTTGPEIWQTIEGSIDVLVAGVGTGGTITGISRYIKKTCGRNITTVAVEPADSPVISQTIAGEELTPGPHAIQGIGAGFIPEVFDLSLVDRVEKIENDDAMEFSRLLTRREGIISGISSGAAIAAAARLASESEYEGKTIVVILPDSGERYLSTSLFEG